MKKFLFSTLFLIIIAFAGIFAGSAMSPSPPALIQAYELSPDFPAKLIIADLGVASRFETVGKDKKGRMAVPQDETKVAWYGLGVKPGEIGNAVVAGHVNQEDLSPGVFANLKVLSPGAKLKILDIKNQEQTFIVESVRSYADADFPITEVFGASTDRKLFLITCDGDFDEKKDTFTKRLVVEARLEKV